MARKTLNAHAALATGQGAELEQHIPVISTLKNSLRAEEEIDPSLVDDWGPIDRLDEGVTIVTPEDDPNSFEYLKALIAEHGQQVPVRLRPSKRDPNRYEIIYGRRRLRACRELGIKVKASVQDMDDHTALLAKGLENAGRRDLSFHEKALFADEISKQGKSAAEVGKVLGVSRIEVQHYRKLTGSIPRAVSTSIGSAPASGRPKWHKLVAAFEANILTEKKAVKILRDADELTSDQRLELLLDKTKPAKPNKSIAERSPVKGVTIKAGQGVEMKVPRGAFADYLNEHLDEFLTEAHEKFKATSKED